MTEKLVTADLYILWAGFRKLKYIADLGEAHEDTKEAGVRDQEHLTVGMRLIDLFAMDS